LFSLAKPDERGQSHPKSSLQKVSNMWLKKSCSPALKSARLSIQRLRWWILG
jgi:hypothetical protein